MPTEPLIGARYPDLNYAANVPQVVQDAVLDIVDNTIPRFATTAARDTAYNSWVSSGNSLADGMRCWTDDRGEWVRMGGAWVSVEQKTFPHFQAGRSSDQAISNATWITVVWNDEIFDTTSGHSPTGTQYTCPVSGFYTAFAVAAFANNGTGIRGIRLQVNGADLRGTGMTNTGAQSVFAQSVATIPRRVYLNLGDVVTVDVYQTSGASLNLIGPGSFGSLFTVVWDGAR